MRRALLVLGWAGCDGGQSGENPYDVCAGTVRTEIDRTDAQLGFSADDVLGGLPTPIGGTWTSLALLDSGERVDPDPDVDFPISWEILALERVELMELPDDSFCYIGEPREQLVLSLSLAVQLGALGEVSSEGTLQIRAAGSSPAEVQAFADWGMPASLTGAYGSALDAWWEAEKTSHPEASDFSLDGTYLTLIGPYDALRMDIEAQHSSDQSRSGSALWRGVLSTE